ncbi:MAG TPA: DinB family protein [Terriglobales bacterium]|nr:DinB family protein [Terriglobales bacterium]
MKTRHVVCVVAGIVLAICASRYVSAQGSNGAGAAQAQAPQQPQTLASVVDRDLSNAEKRLIEVAEAMPESKYSFSPEALNVAGSDFKGVRTFAAQLKHVAASNYYYWAPMTGDKFPDDYIGEEGPASAKSKAEIIKFLKDSFVLGHKAVATLTTENMLQAPEGSKSPRLRLAEFAVAHCFDHYGQMVEYLRMNGIVPPASKGQ